MRISFFEEFPTKDNLSKIKYVDFPTKVYLGAKSLEEFKKIKVNSKHVKKKIYWPILERKEGYWLSPFSKRSAVNRVFNELKRSNVPVMIDAELPWSQNPILFLTQLPYFFSNRRKLRNIIRKHKEVYTAEYFPSSKIAAMSMYFLGLTFKSKNHSPIKMFYSSMHDVGEFFMKREIKIMQKRYGKKLCIGLGTLTHGILGFEPTLSPEKLDRDLRICRELEINEVIIFRLGGMNKKYGKVIKKYIK